MANPISDFISKRLIAPRVLDVLKSHALPPVFGTSAYQEMSLKDAIGQPHDTNYALLYALYKLNADVSGSVHKWAGGITSPGWRFVLMDASAAITPELSKQMRELDRWISHPNPNETLFSIIYETVIHLAITGDAFWYVSKNSKGQPLEIWPMHPALTRIVSTREGEILGYVMRGPAKEPILFQPEEVIHFRLPNPTNSIYGEGRVELIVEEAGIDLQAMRSNKSIFVNGLSPSAVLIMDDQATEAQARSLTDQINQSHQGASNQHKLIAVSRVRDFKPYSMTLKEMEFIGLRGLATEKVTTVMGVPKVLLGNHNAGDYATTKFLVREMHQNVFVPVQQIISQAITEKLIHTVNDALRFEIIKPDSSDPDSLRRDMMQAEAAGILTSNEVRQDAFGKDPVEEPTTPPNQPPTATPVSNPGAVDTGAATEADAAPTAQAAKRVIKSLSRDEQDALAQQREADQEALASDAEPDIAAFFLDQQQRYLDRLPERPDLEGYLIDVVADALLFAALLPSLNTSLNTGAIAAQLQIDISLNFDQINPIVAEYVKNEALTHVQGINATTRDALRVQLNEGIKSGESVEQLAGRIKATFTDASTNRAKVIARTETAQAYSYGNKQTAIATGLNLMREWTASLDERLCAICAPLHGVKVKLDEQYPGGLEPGFCHVLCRCTEIFEVAA